MIRRPPRSPLFPYTTLSRFYQTADLPHPPAPWRGQFDFVFETNTLQVLPAALRPEASRNIAAFLRPGGETRRCFSWPQDEARRARPGACSFRKQNRTGRAKAREDAADRRSDKIGRGSCRGRVEISVGAGSFKK